MPNTMEAPIPRTKNSWKLLMNDVGATIAIIIVYIKKHNIVQGTIIYKKITFFSASYSIRQKIPGIKKPVAQTRILIIQITIAASAARVSSSLVIDTKEIDIIVKKAKAIIPAIPFPLPIKNHLQYLIKYYILKMFVEKRSKNSTINTTFDKIVKYYLKKYSTSHKLSF